MKSGHIAHEGHCLRNILSSLKSLITELLLVVVVVVVGASSAGQMLIATAAE
jgi:hypothetical protein